MVLLGEGFQENPTEAGRQRRRCYTSVPHRCQPRRDSQEANEGQTSALSLCMCVCVCSHVVCAYLCICVQLYVPPSLLFCCHNKTLTKASLKKKGLPDPDLPTLPCHCGNTGPERQELKSRLWGNATHWLCSAWCLTALPYQSQSKNCPTSCKHLIGR